MNLFEMNINNMNLNSMNQDVITKIITEILFEGFGSMSENAMSVISSIKTGIYLIIFIAALSAICNCFAGYLVFRINLAIKGFVSGAVVGAVIGLAETIGRGASGNPFAPVMGLAFVMGIIFAVISYFAYRVGVFINCFNTGMILTMIIAILSGNMSVSIIGLGVIIGFTCGILGCVFCKDVIIIITALEGGATLGTIAGLLLSGGAVAVVLITVVFTVAGILVQNMVFKKKKEIPIVQQPVQEFTQTEPKEIVSIQSNTVSSEACYSEPESCDFPEEIKEELRIVFGEYAASKVKQYPIFMSDTWICACGHKCTSSTCEVCGISKDDAREKISYQYLLNHKTRREQQKINSEKREVKKQQLKTWIKKNGTLLNEKIKDNIGKAKKHSVSFLCKMKSFIMKHKARIIIIGSVIAVVLGCIFFINFCKPVKAQYYNMLAMVQGADDKKQKYYRQSYDLYNNENACLALLKLSIKKEDGNGAKQYKSEMDAKYADNKEYIKLKLQYTPEKPVFNTEEGAYDTWQTLTIEPSQMDGVYTYYSLNGAVSEQYRQSISLNRNGVYEVTAYHKGKYGFDSEKVTKRYEIAAIMPDGVVADYTSGYYTTDIDVQLRQTQGIAIYYTTDGTEPTINSTKYENAIHCSRGDHIIKAISINEKGIGASVSTYEYHVYYPLSGDASALSYTNSASGCSYDYIAVEKGSILQYQNGKKVKEIPINGQALELKYYNGKVYFTVWQFTGSGAKMNASCKGLYVYEEKTGNVSQLSQAVINSFEICDNTIWYFKGGSQLYSMSLNGTDITGSGMYASGIATDQKNLYVVSNNVIYQMTSKTNKTTVTQINDTTVGGTLAAKDGAIYYVSDHKLYTFSGGEQSELLAGVDFGSGLLLVQDQLYYYSSSGETGIYSLTSQTTRTFDLGKNNACAPAAGGYFVYGTSNSSIKWISR